MALTSCNNYPAMWVKASVEISAMIGDAFASNAHQSNDYLVAFHGNAAPKRADARRKRRAFGESRFLCSIWHSLSN